MDKKTQIKLNLKRIKIILFGKEQLREDTLGKVAKQGKKQGLKRCDFFKFGGQLFETRPAEYVKLIKRVFYVIIK